MQTEEKLRSSRAKESGLRRRELGRRLDRAWWHRPTTPAFGRLRRKGLSEVFLGCRRRPWSPREKISKEAVCGSARAIPVLRRLRQRISSLRLPCSEALFENNRVSLHPQTQRNQTNAVIASEVQGSGSLTLWDRPLDVQIS